MNTCPACGRHTCPDRAVCRSMLTAPRYGFDRLSPADRAHVLDEEPRNRRIDLAIVGLIIVFVAWVIGLVFAGETKLDDTTPTGSYQHPTTEVGP